MIISKTPFRVSFFGGGTDYPDWYRQEGGAVLSTTIDKYCYITVRDLPNIFEYNFRLRYFQTEEVKEIADIVHPSIRETAKYLNINKPFELVHFAEMPAKSGLGSSSTFTVGLLNALHAFKDTMVSSNDLMIEAIHIEQRMIGENVGSQDQAAAAFGGFNLITFEKDEKIKVEPIILSQERLRQLNENFILVFTGFSRTASTIAEEQIRNINSKYSELIRMKELTDEALNIITNEACSLDEFGKLLNSQWLIKKEMSTKITNKQIDDIYASALDAGALGGKLLGAGSGGFMLLYAKVEDQDRIKKILHNYTFVNFSFEKDGSRIIHYNP